MNAKKTDLTTFRINTSDFYKMLVYNFHCTADYPILV